MLSCFQTVNKDHTFVYKPSDGIGTPLSILDGVALECSERFTARKFTGVETASYPRKLPKLFTENEVDVVGVGTPKQHGRNAVYIYDWTKFGKRWKKGEEVIVYDGRFAVNCDVSEVKYN